MKVFAPRRLAAYASYRDVSGEYRYVGIPLEGDWVDHDDFFRQVTRGNNINDVIHAKLVDSNGVSYTTRCQWVGPNFNIKLANTLIQSSRQGWVVLSLKHPYKVTGYRLPNYKGKKKIQPRKYAYWTQSTYGFLLDISPSYEYFTNTPTVAVGIYLAKVNPVKKGRAIVRTMRYASVSYDRVAKKHVPSKGARRILSDPEGYASKVGAVLRSYSGYPSVAKFTEVVAAIVDAFKAEDGQLLWERAWNDSSTSTWTFDDQILVTKDAPIPDTDLSTSFLLDELEVYGQGLDPIVLGKDVKFHNYWRNWLTQHALLEACESFPKLNDNSISNILEIAGFIKALVVDHRIEIPKSLSSAWLAYRYQYSTTKMDAAEAIKFVHRHMDLGTLDRKISCYGSVSKEIEGVNVTCRCSIDLEPKNIVFLGKIWRALDTYGLTPDFYVIWDLIPYSFIVDWLIPVGDILGTLDADTKYFSGEYYNLTNLCYSLSYSRELDDGNIVKCYTRWAGSVPSSLNSFYWLDSPGPSSKVVGYRILDALSLFIGR